MRLEQEELKAIIAVLRAMAEPGFRPYKDIYGKPKAVTPDRYQKKFPGLA